MRMRLEQDCAGADDFSPLTPLIAWRADLVKTTMRRGQDFRLRKRPLPGGGPRSIHIDHRPLLSRPIEQTAREVKRFASKEIFLKARTQSFHCRLVKGRKKTRKGRTMRQTISPKQGHERLGKWSEPFVKSQQGRFARKNRADQHGNKIDEVVVAKAGTGEAHLVLDGFENILMGENLSKGCHFSHPGRNGRLRFRSNLDRDWRKRHTMRGSSFCGSRCIVLFSFLRRHYSSLFCQGERSSERENLQNDRSVS